jgi:hypothetical protein
MNTPAHARLARARGKPVFPLLACAAGLAWPCSAPAQGSLTPPGAPAPLFKTLSQIEPRYPISTFQTNLTLPGCYYLTTNLFAGTNNTSDGITIRTNQNNITIDLNGFAIFSTNPAGAPAPVGIRISEATNIVIRNGQISGLDRGVRAEGACYGILVEDLHVSNCSRSGVEMDGVAGSSYPTITVRRCVVEDLDGTGEGANVAVDGIVLLNCTGVVEDCVVRDILPVGTGSGTCINAVSATNSFVVNNRLSRALVGLAVSGGGTRVYYRDNLTAACTTPFSVNGGVDRGGNF